MGNAYTGVQGQYSYVDANGIQQVVSYVADDDGFRILSDTRLESNPTIIDAKLSASPSISPAELETADPEAWSCCLKDLCLEYISYQNFMFQLMLPTDIFSQ